MSSDTLAQHTEQRGWTEGSSLLLCTFCSLRTLNALLGFAETALTAGKEPGQSAAGVEGAGSTAQTPP